MSLITSSLNLGCYFLCLLSILLLNACIKPNQVADKNQVFIRLDTEPDGLHPLISRTLAAKTVERHLFMPLLDFDPSTLKLSPALAKSLPKIETIKDGPNKGGMTYTYEIKDQATWDNGMPILAKDYIFSVKALLNPAVPSAAYRSYFNFWTDIQVDANNPRRFTIYTNRPYILAEAALGSLEIYPQYFYDPESWLADFTVKELMDTDHAKKLLNERDELRKFGEQFSAISPRSAADISSNGPYTLQKWETGQELILTKKQNWWGASLADSSSFFVAHPEQLIFKIIPDVMTATSLLKSEKLDVMTGLTPNLFLQLKDDPKLNYQFLNSEKLQYFYVGLNGNDAKLANRKVRRALAHLMDVDEILETIVKGLGKRLTGPIHPIKDYYNKSLTPIPFDIKAARKLLAEAGWKDTNGNGVLDQVIDGTLEELELTFKYKISNKEAENIGLLFQQNAKAAGVKIILDGKELNTIFKEYRQRDFDMVYLSWSRQPILDDLRQTWHTSSNIPGGSNRTGFGDQESDEIIDEIRVTYAPERRKELYLRIQEIIYREQPYIFLYAPLQNMAIHKKFTAFPSIRYPGFFPNGFQANDH